MITTKDAANLFFLSPQGIDVKNRIQTILEDSGGIQAVCANRFLKLSKLTEPVAKNILA